MSRRRLFNGAPNLPPTPAPRMLGRRRTTSRGGLSQTFAYVGVQCDNISEVFAYVVATVRLNVPEVTVSRGPVAVNDYECFQITITDPDSTPGLVGGPTHRRILQRAQAASWHALSACWDAS